MYLVDSDYISGTLKIPVNDLSGGPDQGPLLLLTCNTGRCECGKGFSLSLFGFLVGYKAGSPIVKIPGRSCTNWFLYCFFLSSIMVL